MGNIHACIFNEVKGHIPRSKVTWGRWHDVSCQCNLWNLDNQRSASFPLVMFEFSWIHWSQTKETYMCISLEQPKVWSSFLNTDALFHLAYCISSYSAKNNIACIMNNNDKVPVSFQTLKIHENDNYSIKYVVLL